MMNHNTSQIDDLLRKLPAIHPGANFTASVMNRIAALPEKAARKLTPWHIAFIIAGSSLLIGLGGWLAHSVWSIEFTFMQRLGNLFTATGASLLSLFKEVRIPSNILGGLIGGIFLLLLDAWLRNKQRKHRVQEAS